MKELTVQQRVENITRFAVGAKENGVDPKQAEHHRRVAQSLRTETEHSSPREVMERARELRIDQGVARDNIEANIGSLDPRRNTQAKNAERLAANVIQKDLIDLSPTEAASMRNSAREALLSMPEAQPLLAEFAADPAGLDAFVMDSLAQLDEEGDLKLAFARQYKEVFGKTDRKNSPEITEAEQKVTEIQNQIKTAEEALRESESKWKAAQEKVDDFEDRTATGGTKGARCAELDAAESSVTEFLEKVGKTEADIKNMRLTQDADTQRLGFLTEKLSTVKGKSYAAGYDSAAKNAEIEAVQREIDTVAQSIEDATRILPQYDAVTQPRDRLNAEKAAAENEVSVHVAENDRLQKLKDKLKNTDLPAANTDLNAVRIEGADTYVKEAQGIMKDALKKLYGERLAKATGVEEAELQKMIDDEVNPVAKKILEQVRDGRWRKIDKLHLAKLRKGNNLGHGEVERFDTKRIESDMSILKAQGKNGPEVIVRNMLEGEMKQKLDALGNPMSDTKGKPIMERVYADDQITDILKTSEFQNKVIPAARDRLLAAAKKTGVLSEKDSELVQSVLGEDVVKNAINAHAAWFEQKKREFKFVGSSVDFIKKHPKLGWWLALSVFYPPAGLLVGGIFATKGLFSGGGHAEKHGSNPNKVKTKAPEHLEDHAEDHAA